MSHLDSLKGQIKNPRSRVFRRLFIKRKDVNTGLYEADWFDISKFVMKWGTVRREIDSTRINAFKFAGNSIVVENNSGAFNASDNFASLWFGFSDIQRTLVKVEAGFVHQTLSSSKIWINTEYPSDPTVFHGFISGNVNLNGKNSVTLPVLPLTDAFRAFNASRLTGYNDSLTASKFVELVRDFTLPGTNTTSVFVFRPFFGDTTANWTIEATTRTYPNLTPDTTTSIDITNKTVWDVISELAQAENFVPYVTNDGRFIFEARGNETASGFEFLGPGIWDNAYGRNIKTVNWFGPRLNKYYSRISVKYNEADTASSFEIKEALLKVESKSNPWSLGERTLEVVNLFVADSFAAQSIATALFEEHASLKDEIELTTSFVTHLDLLELVNVTYDPSELTENSLWDVHYWADTAGAALVGNELTWDSSKTNGIQLNDVEFKINSIAINLDKLESKYVMKRT